MFNAITNADVLAQTLDYPLSLADESKINLNEEGLAIRVVDPSNVAMTDLTLSREAFESYEADGGQVGINLNRFDDVAGMADSGDLVNLELNDETRKFEIGVGAMDFTMALIDPESVRQEPDIPDLDLPASVTLSGAKLNQIVKAADMVSDHLRVGMREAGVFYMAAEGDTDEVRQEFVEDDVEALTPGVADSMLSLDYMEDIVKTFDKKSNVTLTLGEEMPVMFDSEFADGHGEVTFMLAPRIQNQ